MIYTSYFSNIKNLDKDKCVSIAIGTPKWFNGKIIKELQPTWDMVMDHKSGKISDDDYINRYINILSKINIDKFLKDYDDTILLCWCGKNKFCHRHILAEWINKYKKNSIKEL